MKVLKTAKQKCVMVNREFYTTNDINRMLAHGLIFYHNPNKELFCRDSVCYYNVDDFTYYIGLSNVSELKVIYDKTFEGYLTIAVLKTKCENYEHIIVNI